MNESDLLAYSIGINLKIAKENKGFPLTHEEEHVLFAIRNWIEAGEPATWDSVPEEEKTDVQSLIDKGLVKKLEDGTLIPTSEGWSYERESVAEEKKEAVGHAILRHYGIEEPTRWIDVMDAYIHYYQRWKDAILEVSGGYKNIRRLKEYPAEPFESYSKISMVLEKPVEVCFQLKDRDIVEINSKELPLFIDGKAYTPFQEIRMWRFGEPTEQLEKMNRDLKAGKEVCMNIKDFYVQIENPAYYSRFEEKIKAKPPKIIIGIYE